MKKSDIRKIIQEEIQQGDYPELHKVITDRDIPPFMTEEEFEKKWNKKLNLPLMKEWHQDDVQVVSFALLLQLDFRPDTKYVTELKKISKADAVFPVSLMGRDIVILEWEDAKGAAKARKFAMDNYLI